VRITVVADETVTVDKNMTRSIKNSDGTTITQALKGKKGANKACDNYDQASMLAVDVTEINPQTVNENYGGPKCFF